MLLVCGCLSIQFCVKCLNSMLHWVRSGDWLGRRRLSYFFALRNLGLPLRLWLFVHLHCEELSGQFFSICLNLSGAYIPVHFRVHPATSISCNITCYSVVFRVFCCCLVNLLFHSVYKKIKVVCCWFIFASLWTSY